MMNIVEEAIIYATILHQGKRHRLNGHPSILHPLEVAHILSTMTDDQEIITAGILHDIVEGTDGTLEEIEKRFGNRVAFIVSTVSKKEYPGESGKESWRRKEGSLQILKRTKEMGVRMLWLADSLANIRSIAGMFSESGESMWQKFNQNDPEQYCWYFKTIAENLELSLNKTGAFKELIKIINFLWPGTFSLEKGRYKKYREVCVDGCEMIGMGAKGTVYRYDDELIIKVFNEKNTYSDVEREIAMSRRAFVLGIPTAISFGIVSVGDCYGAMYELVDANTISKYISWAPKQVGYYAKIMADMAHVIHSTKISQGDDIPTVENRLFSYISNGIARENEELAGRCWKLIEALPPSDTLIHGDFHTGNVFLQDGYPVIMDMDRVARAHPIVEISDLYYFYVALGEDEPSLVENFMGFSYETSKSFFNQFLRSYLETEDEDRLREVVEKASFFSNIRTVSRLHKKKELTQADQAICQRSINRLEKLVDKLDTLAF